MANKVLKKAFSLDTLLKCKGYDSTFIDKHTTIGFETVLGSKKSMLPKVQGNDHGVLCYSNLSVLYDKERKVPFFSAYNIDGSKKAKKISRANDFRPDPRIDTDIQLTEPTFYDLRRDLIEFEIGHMAANNEMAWGDDAQLQCYQTFHFPNSAPQAANLNTGIWKTLESYIIREAATDDSNKRISVFTGPLLLDDDPGYVMLPSFKIPLLFFKVIVFMSAKGLYSTAFMMSHEQKMIDLNMFVPGYRPQAVRAIAAVPGPFEDFVYKKVFQVNISFLEKQSGLKFSWPGVKTIQVPDDKHQIEVIRKIRDAGDAKKREAVAPERLVVKAGKELSDYEIKKGEFKLNMELP